jgi:hypothetical protein
LPATDASRFNYNRKSWKSKDLDSINLAPIPRGLKLKTELFNGLNSLVSSGTPPKISVVVLIPVFYNPNADGVRKPVEPAKVAETEREIKEHISGYHFEVDGWYRDEIASEEFLDRLIRFEIDFVPDRETVEFLTTWKEILEQRFKQRAIYFKFSGPAAPSR